MNELSPDERAELDWLRRENRLLRVEKDMLLRIATEYALEQGAIRPAAESSRS